MPAQPLVVTLALESSVEERFEAERARWFPAGRSAVGAHVTLFHAVPGALESEVRADLADVAGPPFAVDVTRVMPLGRGAAYAMASDELTRRHRELQRRWAAHLTRQDSQPLRVHVTVQNKVDPAEAGRTVESLRAEFVPFATTATGFRLWRYDNGPWTKLAEFPFTE